MAKSISEVWKKRKQILEGITNSIFITQKVEEIAEERMLICKSCPQIDLTGDKCFVRGTQPCCGVCGCSLSLKVRALSDSCEHPDGPKWEAILTPEEEENINRYGSNIQTGDSQLRESESGREDKVD